MLRFLIILFLLIPSYFFASNKVLTFAPLPLEDIKTIHLQFSPMIKYLEKKLNVKIEIDHNKSYDDILKKFANGKVDIAYLGPLPYLALDKRFNQTVPLVNFKNKFGKVSYTCSLVGFIGERDLLEEKTNLKVALTQPLSTCGYLFVNDILKKSNINIEENKYRYLGRHDKVALSVVRDEFLIGGLKSEIAKKYHHLGLEEIKVSNPIPNFILVGNGKTLDQKILDNLKSSMISVPKNELNTWYKSLKYGTRETNKDDYKHLRELIDSTVIPHESNF